MKNQSKLLYRLRLLCRYVLGKLKFIHFLLPKKVTNELPTGWNNHMFWTAFKSGGEILYFDYYSKLRNPDSYEPKVLVDSAYQFTQEDIRFFYENGYIGPFDLIPPDEVKQLEEHLVDLATNTESKIFSYSQGDYEFKTQHNEIQNIDKIDKKELLNEEEKYYFDRINKINRHLEDPILRNLFKKPAITERCAQILGSDLILWNTLFFDKSPFSSGTKWHQANTWLFYDLKESVLQPPDFEKLFELTCWIALTDAKKDNGCMAVIPGSHREIYPAKLKTDISEKDDNIFGVYEGTLDYPVDPQKVKLIEMKAGQFYIFSERLVHGSVDNVTNDWRWAVNGRITRSDIKVYTKKMLEENHEMVTFGVDKLKLDKWKAVLLCGKDSVSCNRLLQE